MKVRGWFLLGLLMWGAAHANGQDPPERVARLSYAAGVTTPALLNSPLTRGDTLITAEESAAELTLGIAALRVDEGTTLSVLALDQKQASFRLRSGAVNIELRRLEAGETFKLEAREARVQLLHPGDFRITALADGRVQIKVRHGELTVSAGPTSFQQLPGEVAHIETDHTISIERSDDIDDFDRWSMRRKRDFSGARSVRHVARGLVGYEDLDAYGTWRWEREYGMVWEPTRVSAAWEPYRFGEWLWKEPWGWTWVDSAPWGFAPFHYGRWVQLRSRWYWLPGPRQLPPIYAPALVRWERDVWFPLGPGEIFTPNYRASSQHKRRINTFATVSGSGSRAQNIGIAMDQR